MKKGSLAKENEVSMKEYLDAKMELEELRKQHNIPTPKEEESKLSRAITNHFEKKENRPKVKCNRKTYLLLAVLLGWCGGHRFYSRQWIWGILYLVFFWTGIPLAMTIIDLLIAIPLPVDEEGFILV